MFKQLIDSINKYLFKDNNEELVSEPSKEEQSQYVYVTNDDDIVVEIVKECSFDEYCKDISIYEEKYGKLDIPIKTFIYEGVDFIHSKLLKQKINIHKEGGIHFFIVKSNRYLKVIMKRYEEEIHEVDLTMDKYNSTFKLSKYIHDLNLSTKECRFYPCALKDMKVFTLDRLEAFELVKELITYIRNSDELKDIIDIDLIYKCTNLLKESNYHLIISDDDLSLSIRYSYETFDINKVQSQEFDIILNDTKEVIGDISFKYGNSYSDYLGNVSYSIKEQYQNKQYATKALKLLVSLLKNNKYDGDKDLYVSVKPDNYASEKVALKNGGKLFYEGEVPENDLLYSLDGVKEVKIYQIKM